MPESTPMIELINVTKLYGTVIGVNDISLTIPAGTYGLLGPNGSGKTTLINLILGQLKPTIGTVRLFGEDPWKRSRLLRRVGLCPAIEVNFPRMSGYDWVCYLLQMQGFDTAAAAAQAASSMKQVGLEAAMNRPMRNYSLGMRQRTKLAQAISHNPELLILDEPFSGLDPNGRFAMTKLLNERAAAGGSTILASHILHEVEEIDPAFLLISGGRLLASGSSEEVQEILATAPSTMGIRCNDARQLATLLVEWNLVDEVQLLDDQNLVVGAESTMKLRLALPEIAATREIVIYEMTTHDESLKALFSTLMQMHRGEMRKGKLK